MKVLIILSLVLVAVADKPYFCSRKSDYGDCKKNLPRWSYSQEADECRQFLYSGCGGNRNRFFSEDDCMDICINGYEF